nr:AAA family ATPase [Chloroflexota bacterium]
RLRTTRERAESAEQEQARQVRQLEQAMSVADEQGNALRARRQQAQAHIAALRKTYGAASERMRQIERDLAVSEERVTGIERQHGEHQQEERRLRERLIVAQQQIIDLEEQCDLANEAVDDASSTLAALEAQVARAQKDYELDERRLRSAQTDLIQTQARLGATQTDLGRQQKHLGERNRALAARRDTIAQAQQSLRTAATRLVEERTHLGEARAEEQRVTQSRQTLSRTIADAQQEMERLKSALADAERQRRAVSDRLNMLKSWRQSLSGYSDGVRALLRAPTGTVTGLIGPVPQLGVAPAGLETAIEAALGPYLQAVVVQTPGAAHACLDYLRTAHAGRAMLVWLEPEATAESHDALIQREQTALAAFLAPIPEVQEHSASFAWRHIQCEPRYLPLFRRMLRGTIIVPDLDSARVCMTRIAGTSPASAHPVETLVTLGGEVLHIAGWVTGGHSQDGGQHGLLAHERELRELPQQLAEHVALIQQLNAMIHDVQRAQEERRAAMAAVDKEGQKVAARSNELNRVVATTQREQERAQAELDLALSVEQQLAAELTGLEQEIQATLERVRAHEKSQQEFARRVEELQGEVEERALAYRRQQDELGRVRTTVAVKRQEAKSLHQQLANQQKQAQELKAQVEQQVARIQDAEQHRQALHEAIALHRVELERARTQTQGLAQEIHAAENQVSEVDQQIVALEQQGAHLRHTLSELEVVYRRCLLDSQKARDAVETLLEQLREEMDISDPRELAGYATQAENSTDMLAVDTPQASDASEAVEDPEALSEEEELRLRRLRRKVDGLRGRLKALGGCDPTAPQQYEEARTRFEFLSSQIADMEQAALHLRAIIGQLDVTMARQFEATFQAVNARFGEHFTTLFNGGHARLELLASRPGEDEAPAPSSMPSGIEVIVQPPGKKVQDLSLLSGGERALVSAALLFSLLEINPPPFCLLDEVDAALDESNVTRFSEILKRLAQRTQFIVITHNRVTMTAAQAIYGVSMGGDSISRLLSLRLEEAPVAGDR